MNIWSKNPTGHSNRQVKMKTKKYGLSRKRPSWKRCWIFPSPPPPFFWRGLQYPWPPSGSNNGKVDFIKKIHSSNTEYWILKGFTSMFLIMPLKSWEQTTHNKKIMNRNCDFYTILHNNEKDLALIWMHTMKIDCFINVRPNIPSQENELPWTGRSILFLVVVVIQSPYWCYQTEPQAGGF